MVLLPTSRTSWVGVWSRANRFRVVDTVKNDIKKRWPCRAVRCFTSVQSDDFLPKNVFDIHPLHLHHRKKKVDPRYADDEEDRKTLHDREQAVLNQKKFRKRNLLAEHYAKLFTKTSLTIFVQGSLNDSNAKNVFREMGISTLRLKSNLIKIAAKKMSPESDDQDEHIRFAESLSRGLTSIACVEDSLLTLVSDQKRFKKLVEALPLSDRPDGALIPSQWGFVVGALIRDAGKNVENIWLTRAGLKNLLDILQEESKYLPDAKDMPAHNIFHAKLVGTLRNQVGAIRQPLQAVSTQLRDTLDGIPRNLAGTLAKVETLRKEVDKKEST